jgi:hypothetical protein
MARKNNGRKRCGDSGRKRKIEKIINKSPVRQKE